MVEMDSMPMAGIVMGITETAMIPKVSIVPVTTVTVLIGMALTGMDSISKVSIKTDSILMVLIAPVTTRMASIQTAMTNPVLINMALI